MRIPRIYSPQPLAEHTSVQLDGAAAHHVVTVLRMKVGRQLVVFNGEGQEFLATLTQGDKKKAEVSIDTVRDGEVESPLCSALGVCLIKNDRMDWLLQKATELGVSAIYPLVSEYTDLKLSPARLEKKALHWQQVVISACEQSGRVRVPKVAPLQKLEPWLVAIEADNKYVLHPYRAQPLRAASVAPKGIALLVGPEGGLSEAEVDAAHGHGFQSIALGPRILRAETAPLVALSLLQQCYGDFA